jgi:hypothetical protein
MNAITPDAAPQSRHRMMVKGLRADLADETDCLYFVHTPAGTINVIAWNYAIPGFVAIRGEDEHQKYRFLVFSEDVICSFPLEVRRKKTESSKSKPGFKPTVRDE